ncbi:hypothetical protein M409DRAFT_67849 [Zasmidium cellare ATCC 36951]|uniref:NAD-dependent epimerase/dehydratase domain-containing protein n=1 Tax=Zasmidium cellare ATCC 36951 TaxID=1080233 RepID=A0A6A6CDN9_ZASCE|nr:uncharacterized protein M409DRAFT_67849 [Zasmidium cellare ATCC 36951]KAF2164288.1 hypothetical protein M409DRAFT_67849 [Zasmidium cellare ATCC 36951]
MGSINTASAKILITGAAGFVGQALAPSLTQDPAVESIALTDITQPALPAVAKDTTCRITSFAADFISLATCEKVVSAEFTHIYLLHGIMSGAAEANLDLGLKVNVDSMRYIIDVLRRHHRPKPVRIIFPSSLAVFGPPGQGEVVTENTMPIPRSSYGTEKAMVELLLNDLSRRGLVDARILRLPTIIVRPGKPPGAASSFCSGIIREPLNGKPSILPVPRALKLWVCPARTVIRNLVAAKDIPEARFIGSCIVNLPGQTVTVDDMLQGLRDVGGQKALGLIQEQYDEKVASIVGSWPAVFDTEKAIDLGFHPDVGLGQTLKDYIEDYMH